MNVNGKVDYLLFKRNLDNETIPIAAREQKFMTR